MKRIVALCMLMYSLPMIGAVSSTHIMVEVLHGNKQAIENYIKKGGKLDIRLTEDENTLLHIAINELVRGQNLYEKTLYGLIAVAAGGTAACFYTEQKLISLVIAGSGIGFYFVYKKLVDDTFKQYMEIVEYLIAQLPASIVHAKNKARPPQTALSLVQNAACRYYTDERFVNMMIKLEKLIQEKK